MHEDRVQQLEVELAAARAEIEGWKRVAVIAVAPLEAINMSGSIVDFAAELQHGVIGGITVVRDAIGKNQFPKKDHYLTKMKMEPPRPSPMRLSTFLRSLFRA